MDGFFDWRLQLTYQFFLIGNSYLQLILSYLPFTNLLQKRPQYPIRLAVSLTACASMLVFSAALRFFRPSPLTRVLVGIIKFSLLFLISYLCYDDSFQNRIRAICCGTAARYIGSAVYSFLLLLAGVDETQTISILHPDGLDGGLNTGLVDWLLYFGIRIAVYFVVYRVVPFRPYDNLDQKSLRQVVALSIFCFAVMVVPDTIRNEIGTTGMAGVIVNRFYHLSVGAFVLFTLTSVDFQSRYRQEKAIIEQALDDERKQYQQLKEDMDIINVYCHDLRHQIKSFSVKLTEKELDSLSRAMELYDSNIKTGNEVLDVVLRAAQMRCRKEEIELTCLADGAALDFIDVRHLYSLFNNALNNAMEAVRKLADRSKRVISVTVARQDGALVIEVVNFFDGNMPADGGSTKREKGQHGFGLKSMRYVAESYGGRLSVRIEGELYCLTISIPTPKTPVGQEIKS